MLFFGGLFSSVMPAGLSVAGKAGIVVIMLTMAVAWFSSVAALAGTPSVMRVYDRASQAIDAVAGGLFVVIGAALLPR